MKTIQLYFNNREAAISFLLDRPGQKYTSATFHKLRVEIKKLDALFDLINYCSKNFRRDKYFKPFKLIFHQAGKVRELQLEETTLKRYTAVNSLKGYRINLRNQLLKEQDEFFIVTNRKLIEKLKTIYHQIVPFVNNVSNTKVNAYIKKRKGIIEKIIKRKHLQMQDPRELHELRKKLKKFNYNRKSLPVENKNKPLANKNVLPVLLGKWHDCQVIILHLQKVIEKGEINSKEIGQLQKIEQKISADRELQLKKIQRAIPKSEFFIAPNKLLRPMTTKELYNL